MERLTIYNGDAYEVVKELKERNVMVDHIITDPPYNISKDNNFSTMKHPRAGVDFGVWDRGKFDLYSWIPEYSKILNKNGSMIIFCSYRYISYIIDRQGENIPINISAYTLQEVENKNVDAVICCYLDDGDIRKELEKHFECDIITIEELLYEL